MGKPKKPRTPLDQLPIEARLKIKKYSSDACNAAIHGQHIPVALGYELTRLSVIRGIRHHHGFAQELRGVTPEFTRALNARDIMSGIIPTISKPDETPYCIWHPDVPDEGALRALVQRYPQMLYHAARACAVAGYIDLYKELDPLPEVHVAEEASYASVERSNKGSQEIYQRTTSQQVKFAIMNDYTRTVDINDPRVAFLNGDTAVFSSLGGGREHVDPKEISYFYREPGDRHYTSNYFNITEDWGIDDHNHEAPDAPESYFPLLYGPLPIDLPPVNKDKLIVMAAYLGDIDRYARLHRPQMVRGEFFCIIRGIYHNSFWAKWWSTQITQDATTRFSEFETKQIQRAINARRIMSDDITWVTAGTPKDLLPMNIWFPGRACAETYERLARIRPGMLRQCLHACIVADYPEMWDKVLLLSSARPANSQTAPAESETQELKLQQLSRVVGPAMWMEAKASHNDHYRRDIAAAVPDKLESVEREFSYVSRSLFLMTSKEWYFPRSDRTHRWVDRNDPVHVALRDQGEHDGVSVRIPSLDFAIFARDAVGVDHDIWRNEKDGRLELDEVYDLLEEAEASHRSVAQS
ncbi:unnamed protein product [Penicillium egyptiacum]|uniref:Uncharacterized protein n=1 Tax=Penicillium egyptiacum TaxID=1303716 RepID=A0A9W4P7I9_9EURO|nr:unnamed protein product [Penicillium egyptiacum]